jgi:REJ domain
VFGTTIVTKSVVTLPPNVMKMNTTYTFLLAVSSRDGRSSSQTVSVTPLLSGSPEIFVTSLFGLFNPEAKLVIEGHISHPLAVTSAWTAYTPLGVPVPFKSLTHATKTISASTDSLFPLCIAGGEFVGGKSYTFRLSGHPIGVSSMLTFAEITLTANSPPTGGYMSSTPSRGDALMTKFLLSTAGWTADVTSFPLSYSFSYRLSVASQYLSLAASSLRAYTVSTLPAGLRVLNGSITVQGEVTDVLMMSGTAKTAVIVVENAAANTSHIMTESLSSAFSTGDVNLAVQTVNNVSCRIRNLNQFDIRRTLFVVHCSHFYTKSLSLSPLVSYRLIEGDSSNIPN